MIFDEAHEIEDVVGQYFGVSVSNTQLDDLRRDVQAIARLKNFGSAELDRILQTVHELSDRFFSLVPDAPTAAQASASTTRSSKRTGTSTTIFSARSS